MTAWVHQICCGTLEDGFFMQILKAEVCILILETVFEKMMTRHA